MNYKITKSVDVRGRSARVKWLHEFFSVELMEYVRERLGKHGFKVEGSHTRTSMMPPRRGGR